MSSGLKVLVACLAAFGLIMVGLMILGFIHWIVIGIAVLAAVYVAVKLVAPQRKAITVGDRKLHKQLRRLEKDLDPLRKK